LIFIMIIQCNGQCQYYTVAPLRTNYSTFTEVYSATNGRNIPIHVCHGSVIYYNETVIAIQNDTTIIGDIQPSGLYAVWTIMTPQSPVFWTIGLCTMSVTTVNIVFTETLFYVDLQSTLLFDNVFTWDGNISVLVSGSQGYGMGFTAVNSRFSYVAVAIRYIQGSVSCSNCIFFGTRLAAIITPSRSLQNIFLSQPVFENVVYPLATFVGPSLTASYMQLIVPSDSYILTTGMVVCRNYPSYQAPVVYNCSDQLVGGSGNAKIVEKNCQENTIITSVVLALIAVLVIVVIALYLYSKDRKYPANVD